MPVMPCQKNDRPGFKWGPNGFCYTYIANDSQGRRIAKNKAREQGRAIIQSGGR